MSQPISMPWSAPAFGQLPHKWQGVRMAQVYEGTGQIDRFEIMKAVLEEEGSGRGTKPCG